MNVLEKSKRRWKKARKRGVSPIIATILLVAITVVLAAVLYVLISGLTSGGANTVPIGTAFAYGQATACPSTSPGTCYSVGIQSAGSSATTSNIHFAVQSAGSPVTVTGTVALVDNTGAPVATYTFGSGWDNTGIAFQSTETLVFTITAPALGVAGDSLVAQGVGSLQGTTAIALP